MGGAGHLRGLIEHLARLDRASCSAGEHEAANWIAAALRERGASAEVELERVHGTYWWPLGLTSALGVGAAIAGLAGRRLLGVGAGAVASALVTDELRVGRRWLRRLLPGQLTANVVAWTGDPAAEHTVMLVAHHDAAHSGFFFNPRIGAALARLTGGDEQKPPRIPGLMTPLAAGPALAGLGALTGIRRLAALGGLVCAGIVASFTDIARRATVPGANDNLTGVITLLAVAEALRDRPVKGIRVLLVSTGAEESLMEGMCAFAARHFPAMSAERTRVVCVDTVGSPYLVLAEAEGMLEVREYDASLKQLIADCAERAGIDLVRGITMRFGTDGYVALRAGFPSAMLMSVDSSGTASNYHWPTDTPDRVDYGTLQAAVRLCELIVRRLSDDGLPTPPASAPGAALRTADAVSY